MSRPQHGPYSGGLNLQKASICDANGARGCAVRARVELAAALTRPQAPGDRDEALAALAGAAHEAGQLGMAPVTELIGQLPHGMHLVS